MRMIFIELFFCIDRDAPMLYSLGWDLMVVRRGWLFQLAEPTDFHRIIAFVLTEMPRCFIPSGGT